MVKNLPVMQGTWVWSLGQEDALEMEMATHSSISTWRIPWTEKPAGLQSMGSQRVRHDWMTNTWASLVAQRLKCLPTMQETRVPSLGQEDSLEKEMVTHSSIFAWRIPWTEKPGGLQSTRSQRVRHNWATSEQFDFIFFSISGWGIDFENYDIEWFC